MARSSHPKKEVEEALRHAEGQGWRVEVGGSHAWGRIYCPYNVRVAAANSVSPACGVRRRTLAAMRVPCGESWTTARRTASSRKRRRCRGSTMEYTFT